MGIFAANHLMNKQFGTNKASFETESCGTIREFIAKLHNALEIRRAPGTRSWAINGRQPVVEQSTTVLKANLRLAPSLAS
jgi:hypothetical protein